MPGYRGDLAYIHHKAYGTFARNAAPALIGMLRQNGIHAGLVVDLGCGSGIWAAELVRAGYEVFGADISPSMLKIAKKQAPGATFVPASLFSVDIPDCAAITSIGECLNYTLDPTSGGTQLRRLFRRVHNALKPGGLFVFDIAQPGQLPPAAQRREHWQGEDWAVLLQVTEDRRRHLLTRTITIFRKAGRLFRKSQEVHVLRLYEGPAILAALERTGFRVRTLRGYGTARLPRTHIAFVARKPDAK